MSGLDMRELLAPFMAELATLRPAGAPALDVHTHLGLDEDGMALTLDELLALLDEGAVEQACVFPLHDPARTPAYRVPNDRVLGWAAESGGRLVPFCRLDPGDDPVGEGERCLEAGARGIKLHPRAQAFHFGDGLADPIFELAERARVPILIHAGRGMPHHFAEGLVEVALRHPDVVLVLAHLGVADMGTFAAGLRDHPNVLYDTSWFNAFEHLELLARVPAERVVYGTDPPYGRPVGGLYLILRAARAAGLDDARVAGMIGGTMLTVLDGGELLPATSPCRSETVVANGRLVRLHNYCMMAFGAVFGGNRAAAAEMLDLAAAVCRDPEPGAAAPVLEIAGPALAGARELLTKGEDEVAARQALGPVFFVMAAAATLPGPAPGGA